MRMRPSAWGAIAGIVIALALLTVASVMLLNSGGSNYKVLVAVWLWLLPVTGAFAGIGYGAGKVIEAATGTRGSAEEGDLHADAG